MEIRRIFLTAAALTVVFASGDACHSSDVLSDNPFTGCYDNSCVDSPMLVAGIPPLATIAAFTDHTCGLTSTGDAWCWGDNTVGQLGDGSDQPRSGPVKVAGSLSFTSISVGSDFTCALAQGGTVYCWGDGTTSQLGQPAPDKCGPNGVACAKSPFAITGRTFTAITTGARHACATDTAGAAYCWGFNFLGETGSSALGEAVTTPTKVPGSNVFATLGGGDSYTCALTPAGRAWCWGSDNRGELGRSVSPCNSVAGFPNICSPTPVAANTTSSFTLLSVGSGHVCGITTSNTALCWGDNGQGQLGTNTYANPDAPVLAQNGMTFTTIESSGPATCGTPTTGPSVCWGLNLYGMLGVGTRIDLSTTPLPIVGNRRYVSFAGGQDYMCALTAAGEAYCWGGGRVGQLGNGPMAP